jgi:hypothetical protein
MRHTINVLTDLKRYECTCGWTEPLAPDWIMGPISRHGMMYPGDLIVVLRDGVYVTERPPQKRR